MKYLALAALLALNACATAPPSYASGDPFDGTYVRANCDGRADPADCRAEGETERLNSVRDRCDPAYQRATHYEFFEDDQPNCPGLRRPGAGR